MRRVLLLGAFVLAASAGAAAALLAATSTIASPEPTPAPPQLYLMDGPLATRIENGVRMPIANGWDGARFAGFAPGRRTDLDILVVSGATKAPTQADVTVIYQMIEMDHDLPLQRARPGLQGHHAATLDLNMIGTWRITIRVLLDGVTSDVVLLLAPGS